MAILSKNVQGRPYINGRRDDTIWSLCATILAKEPDIFSPDLAERLLINRSTAYKIRKCIEEGKTKPLPTGKQAPSYKTKQVQRGKLLEMIVDIDPNLPLKDYQHLFPTSATHNYSIPHLCKLLKKYKLTRKSPLYFHPNKWKHNNAVFYEEFLFWVMEQPLEVRSRFKFFDEVRVDQRDIFKPKPRGKKRRYIEKSRMPGGEVYTVCLLFNVVMMIVKYIIRLIACVQLIVMSR